MRIDGEIECISNVAWFGNINDGTNLSRIFDRIIYHYVCPRSQWRSNNRLWSHSFEAPRWKCEWTLRFCLSNFCPWRSSRQGTSLLPFFSLLLSSFFLGSSLTYTSSFQDSRQNLYFIWWKSRTGRENSRNKSLIAIHKCRIKWEGLPCAAGIFFNKNKHTSSYAINFKLTICVAQRKPWTFFNWSRLVFKG